MENVKEFLQHSVSNFDNQLTCMLRFKILQMA